MASPFTIIQTASFRPEVTASQLARAAVMVASAIGDWDTVASFSLELNGYDTEHGDPPNLPKYRQGHARVMADDRWGRHVPVYFSDPDMMDRLSTVPVIQSLSAIEVLTNGMAGGSYEVEFAGETHAKLLRAVPNAVRLFRVVQQAQFLGVLEGARQNVFAWCLEKVRAGVQCPSDVDLRALLPAQDDERVEPLVAPAGISVSASNSSVVIQSPAATSSVSQSTTTDTAALQGVVSALAEGIERARAGGASAEALAKVEARLDELTALSVMKSPRTDWVRQAAASTRTVLEQATGSIIGALATPHVQALLAQLIK